MKKLLPEACKECIKESANACKLCRQKHISDLQDLKNFNNDLIDKCAELEKQLDNIKYLDRDNVEKIIMDYKDFMLTVPGNSGDYEKDREIFWKKYFDTISAICKLALPSEEVKEMKGLEKIKELIKIQKESAKDDYMVGLYNGLELARATLENNDPNYMDCFNTKENISK